MTTLTDMLDTLVNIAFSPAQKTTALNNAALILGVTAGADDDTDMAIALYASGMLSRGRAVHQNKTNPSITVPTMESLFTVEVQRLLNKDAAPTRAQNLIIFSNKSSTKSWTNSRS